MQRIAKRLQILTLIFCILFGCLFTRVNIFGAGNSSIVFSKSREPTKKIALTFDDGPHPRYTERILKILERYDIKATFFVIGVNIQNYPEPFAKIVAAGHEIGNHTYHHKTLSGTCDATIREEIRKTDEIIFKTAGYRPKIFRPPEGAYGECALKAAQSMDLRMILWTVDTRDWERPSAQTIVERVMANVKGGSILLFHDYMHKNAHTLEALEIILPKLLEKGFEFVTVSELIER